MLRLTVLLLVATAAFGMKIAVPSYFYATSKYWGQIQSNASAVSIAMINPGNGPGSKVDKSFLSTTKACQSKGVSVLGYVHTSWGKRSLSECKAEIDKYYSMYKVDGIFFDEGATKCGNASYYKTLNTYVKAKGGKGITATNPGCTVPEVSCNACTNADGKVVVLRFLLSV